MSGFLYDSKGNLLNPAIDTKYAIATENNASGSPIYYGEAIPGTTKSAAGWRIQKYTYDVNGYFTDRQYADGNTNLDNVWDNRATYSYS